MQKSRPTLLLSLALLMALSTATAESASTLVPLQEYAQRLANGTEVRIGLYGSSTYAGVWSSEGASGRTEQGPGYWMEGFLNAYYMNAAAVVDSSASVPGSTTVDFVDRWQGMMASTANQVVVLDWGANDCTKMSAGEFKNNLTYLVNTARVAGRTPVLDAPHQMTAFAGTTNVESIKQFAEVVRQVAREIHVPLIDSQEWSEQVWRTPDVSLHRWISDGMHLSQDGLRAKGAQLASVLIGTYPRVSGEQTISTELPEWRVGGEVSHTVVPATRHGQTLTGRNFRLAFYAERPHLDLYIAMPLNTSGGEIEVKFDGKDIGRKVQTLFVNMKPASVDVDTMIAENMLPGFHVVEMNAPGPVAIYYARFAESRASRLSVPPLRPGARTPGFALVRLPLRYTIRKAEQSEGVVLTEIPLSNFLRVVSVEVVASFGPDEGLVLFASRYGTANGVEQPRGGVYVYLNAEGYLNVREWAGASGYTHPVQLCDNKLDGATHTYTAQVSQSGAVTVAVDGVNKGIYNMTVKRTGGFWGSTREALGA